MNQYLTDARESLGAKKERVMFTDKEVEAINAGAISSNRLDRIIRNADDEQLKQAFMPKQNKGLTATKLAKARTRLNKGYTNAEVAESLGVSVSTLLNALKS